jgi:Fur family transcriptional regulator, ferric uptake regulator
MPDYHQTKQRRLLLEVMSDIKGHVSAKELFRLASARDNTISPATVYRSLNLFKKQGLIEEKHLGHSVCVYEIKGSMQDQHLVCSGCGKVIDFRCPLTEMVEKIKNDYGFKVIRAEVYFEGYCVDCTEQEK